MAAWHVANRATKDGKEREKVRNRTRYKQEATRRRAEAQAYYDTHQDERRDYARQYRADNPQRRREQHDRRAELMLGNPGFVSFSNAEWEHLKRQYDHRCAYCGTRAELEKDHVIPLARGGRHALANILPACKPCNISKYNHLLSEWRYEHERR